MPIRTYALLSAALATIAMAAPAPAQRQPGPSHPDQAPVTMRSNVQSGLGIVPLETKKPVQEIVDPHLVPPHGGPGPLHSGAPAAANNPHAIIFVGGHAALNPQPIPPGRVWRRPPHPVAPLSEGAHR